jgi:hypothetical protein
MQESLTDLLMRYGREQGMMVRRVPWEEAQRDKEASRRRDREDIAAGRVTPEQVTVRNSGGLAGRQMVVIDKAGAYL